MTRMRSGAVVTDAAPKTDDSQRFFIGWLNSERGVSVGATTATAKLGGRTNPVTGGKLLGALAPDRFDPSTQTTDTSLNTRRRKGIESDLARCEARLNLLPPAFKGAAIDRTQVRAWITTARRDVTAKDLSVTEDFDALGKLLEKIQAEISRLCRSLGPGADAALKEIARVEASTEFQAAIQVASTSGFTGRLNSAKEMVTGTNASVPVDVPQALNKVKALFNECREITAGQSKILQEIAAVERKLTAIEAAAATKCGKAIELKAYIDEQLAAVREQLEEARKPPEGSLTQSAIVAYNTSASTAVLDAEREAGVIETFVNGISATATPADKKKIGEIRGALQTLNDYLTNAVAQGFTAPASPTLVDVQNWAAARPLVDADVAKAKQLADSVTTYLQGQAKSWEDELARAAQSIRLGRRIIAAIDTRLAEMEGAEGSATYKAVEAQGAAARGALAKYDEALKKARSADYAAAKTLLNEALDGGFTLPPPPTTPSTGATPTATTTSATGSTATAPTATSARAANAGLKVLATDAKAAYSAVVVPEKDVADRKRVFGGVEAEMNRKGRLRLNDDALGLIMGTAGITVNEDGDLQMSDQFKEMQAQIHAALGVWNDLRSKGFDPFLAADKAFAGIPENFWPVEAVRVLAMFRRAEGEFGEERKAELEASLQKSRLGKGAELFQAAIDKATDWSGQGAGAMKSVSDDVMKGVGEYACKAKFANWEDMSDELKQKTAAGEILDKTKGKLDLEQASKALGGLAAGLGAINGLVQAGMSLKDGIQAQRRVMAYDPATDSPVELKTAQFERMRAIWHFVDSMANAVLSAVGPLTEAVPGFSIAGDTKTLLLSVADAVVYFERLHKARTLKVGASYDPDTMSDIALANEAYRLGVLGSKKTFDAATAILKIAGAAAELGGISAPGGWALKYGTMTLEYCGKAFFKINDWLDHRKAMRTLWKAKADPTNVNIVELVFENCTMYARFSLAYGALNNDTWARQYLLSRGLNDRDLDNVNTSTSVLREYMNVTFQTVQGEAEEDDDLGQLKRAKQEQREKRRAPLEEEHLCPWSATDVQVKAASFQAMYAEAVTNGLTPDKTNSKAVAGAIAAFRSALDATGLAFVAFETAYTDFNKAVDAGKADLTAETGKAKELLSKAVAAGVAADHARGDLFDLLQDWTPTAKVGGKLLQHASMKVYLAELADTVQREYDPVRTFRAEAGKKRMALEVGKKSDDPNFLVDAQKKFEQMLKDSHTEIKGLNATALAQFKAGLGTLVLATKSLGKGSESVLLACTTPAGEKLKTKFDLAELTRLYNEQAAKLKEQFLQSMLLRVYQIATESKKAQDAVNLNAKLAAPRKTDQVAKLKIRRDKQIETEAVRFWLDQLKEALGQCVDDAVNAAILVKAKPASGTPTADYFQYTTAGTLELSRAYWHDCKAAMELKEWKFRRTGIGPALDEFSEAHRQVKNLPKDPHLQHAWHAAYGPLQNLLKRMPLDRKDGTQLPGGKELQVAVLQELQRKKDEFDNWVFDPEEESPSSENWSLSDTKLAAWPATEEGWRLMHQLASTHGWEGHNSVNSFGKQFRKIDEAADPTEKRAAAKALADKLRAWKPNKKLGRSRKPHPGIEKYQQKMVARLDAYVGNPTATAI